MRIECSLPAELSWRLFARRQPLRFKPSIFQVKWRWLFWLWSTGNIRVWFMCILFWQSACSECDVIWVQVQIKLGSKSQFPISPSQTIARIYIFLSNNRVFAQIRSIKSIIFSFSVQDRPGLVFSISSIPKSKGLKTFPTSAIWSVINDPPYDHLSISVVSGLYQCSSHIIIF